MPEIQPPPRGNQRGRRHGTHAVVATEVVQTVADAIRPLLPVQHRADELALHELAEVQIRLHRVRTFLDEHDPWEARISAAERKRRDRATRSALRWEDKYAARTARLLRDMGLTPASRAKLGLNIARTVSLAEAMSEPDPQRRAALLDELGVGADLAADGDAEFAGPLSRTRRESHEDGDER